MGKSTNVSTSVNDTYCNVYTSSLQGQTGPHAYGNECLEFFTSTYQKCRNERKTEGTVNEFYKQSV